MRSLADLLKPNHAKLQVRLTAAGPRTECTCSTGLDDGHLWLEGDDAEGQVHSQWRRGTTRVPRTIPHRRWHPASRQAQTHTTQQQARDRIQVRSYRRLIRVIRVALTLCSLLLLPSAHTRQPRTPYNGRQDPSAHWILRTRLGGPAVKGQYERK